MPGQAEAEVLREIESKFQGLYDSLSQREREVFEAVIANEPEVSGYSSTSCARLAQATSMPTSRPWPNGGPPRWWSATMDCS